MQSLISFKKEVLKVDKSSFKDLSLRIFQHQAKNNLVYQKYLKFINKNCTQVKTIEEIPFLPIEFFKTHTITTGNWKSATTFLSSGTTGSIRSSHTIEDVSFYHQISARIFEENYSPIEKTAFLALLPSYIEQGNSSLVSMIDYFISKSSYEQSGFYLKNFKKLIDTITFLKDREVQTVLFGVTYALLELIEEYNPDFSGITVIETGGMKGRRQELSKNEIHEILSNGLNLEFIHSEYGMTEMLSQAYSKNDGIFNNSSSLHVMIRDINDPFDYVKNGKSGGVNVIDLANIHSCCFIETKDIGLKLDEDHFRILGRFDNSDVRGCNLLVN